MTTQVTTKTTKTAQQIAEELHQEEIANKEKAFAWHLKKLEGEAKHCHDNYVKAEKLVHEATQKVSKAKEDWDNGTWEQPEEDNFSVYWIGNPQ